MSRVKICGITETDDRDVAVAAGADAVGLTVDVSVDTPREIEPELAAELAASTPPFVTTVLVTMAETPESVLELLDRIQPDVVQLHGDHSPAELRQLASETHAAVVKAVATDEAERFDSVADALLVDSLDEAGAGGTGRTHDWDRARELVATLESPVILAGGLTPENVGEAVDRVQPFAVDVASGVEARPGRKDPDAVETFVKGAAGGA
jgi:phosphoribosylanthranilate isomerase